MARRNLDEKILKRGEKLARLIQKSRKSQGLTQEELAIKTRIRIDTLRSIESGRIHAPNVFLVADIAIALKEDLNEWLK